MDARFPSHCRSPLSATRHCVQLARSILSTATADGLLRPHHGSPRRAAHAGPCHVPLRWHGLRMKLGMDPILVVCCAAGGVLSLSVRRNCVSKPRVEWVSGAHRAIGPQ